jgi:peptidoglycan/xylan/chitin deacetylase (PgdA/CDA1 family)
VRYVPATLRERVEWPGGARLALVVYVNIEYFRYDLPSPMALTPPQADRIPDVINYAWRDYGTRVGIFRLAETLGQHGARATALLNSEVCRAFPEVVEECMARDWEIADHGVTNSMHLYGRSADDQRAMIRESIEAITAFTGKRPIGWLSPGLSESSDSLQVLWEEGFRYVLEWGLNDDLPYPLTVGDGSLLAIPYPQETNDLPMFIRLQRSAEEGYRQFVDQFDVLYEEAAEGGKVMTISLHPYIIGVPHRIKVLDRVLEHVRAHDDVAMMTAEEVDSWYRTHHLTSHAVEPQAQQGGAR